MITYKAVLLNNWCASKFLTSGFVGGLSIEKNPHNLPKSILRTMEKLAEGSKEERICLEIAITVILTGDQLSEKIQPFFEKQAVAEIPQRFRGSNPLDQRPAVTAGELFAPLIELISPMWAETDFKVTQQKPPMVSCHLMIDGELADQVMRLIRY